jgi:hypothetical protein
MTQLTHRSCQRALEDPRSGLFKFALRADRALLALREGNRTARDVPS